MAEKQAKNVVGLETEQHRCRSDALEDMCTRKRREDDATIDTSCDVTTNFENTESFFNEEESTGERCGSYFS